jgi:hypothetical protein
VTSGSDRDPRIDAFIAGLPEWRQAVTRRDPP